VRCLATMAVAQGLCTNLLEYAWKINLQAYCPDSASFTAYLGDVASFTGVATVGLMLTAPSMFKTLGWRRTARATPTFLLYAGGPFFLLGTAYQVITHYRMLLSIAQPLLFALTVRCAFALRLCAAPRLMLSCIHLQKPQMC
jgi:ATP/ADP translocase